MLIPWAMPMIVAGRAARWGFNGQYGFVNDLIGRFVENFHYDWLIDVDSARIAVIIVDLWKDIPYFAILVLAALQYISGISMKRPRLMELMPSGLFQYYIA